MSGNGGKCCNFMDKMGGIRGLLGALVVPVLIVVLAVALVISSCSTSFTDVLSGDAILYSKGQVNRYAEEQYAKRFATLKDTDGYEECLLLVLYVDADSAEDSTVESTIESTVDSTAESTIESTIESTVDSTAESTVESTAESTVDSTAESTVESTVESTEDSTADSTEESIVASAVDFAEDSAVDSAVDSTEDSTADSAEDSTVDSAEDSAEDSAVDSTEDSTADSTDKDLWSKFYIQARVGKAISDVFNMNPTQLTGTMNYFHTEDANRSFNECLVKTIRSLGNSAKQEKVTSIDNGTSLSKFINPDHLQVGIDEAAINKELQSITEKTGIPVVVVVVNGDDVFGTSMLIRTIVTIVFSLALVAVAVFLVIKRIKDAQEEKPAAPAEEKAEVPAEEKSEAPAEEKAEAPAEEAAEAPAEEQ